MAGVDAGAVMLSSASFGDFGFTDWPFGLVKKRPPVKIARPDLDEAVKTLYRT
jgi:hypothetical protein